MSTNNALSLGHSGDYTEQQLNLLINHLCKGFDSVETDFFLQACKRMGLDPFKRQAYAAPRYEKDPENPNGPKVKRMVIMTSIEGLRAIASRCKTAESSDAYAGNDKPLFFWLDGDDKSRDAPYSAECTVWRIVGGERRAFTAEVFFDECVQEKEIWKYDEKTRRKQPSGEFERNAMWTKRPKGQLGKCAEAAALRKAFPEETAGLYVEEEGPAGEEHHATKPEPPKPTSTAVRETDQPTHEAEAEVLDNEEQGGDTITHWNQLIEDGKWKDIRLEEPFPGITVLEVSNDTAKLTAAWKQVPTDTVQRHALYASQWAKIERYIASSGIDLNDAQNLLRNAKDENNKAILEPTENILDYPGHKLTTLHKALQKAVRANQSP